MSANRVRVAIVTNIPAPYRVPVFNRLGMDAEVDLHVIYAAEREPDRDWDLPTLSHSHAFLREDVFRRRNGRFVHNNPDVFTALRRFSPDVVLTTGFNPTHLYAFAYARMMRRPHVVMTDGTPRSESELSWMHRTARRWVIKRSHAFVAASRAGGVLLAGYGAPAGKVFISPLCANTSVQWQGLAPREPMSDFLFSGRLVDVKNPLFALAVAEGAAAAMGRRVSITFLGAGPLDTALRARAASVADRVDVRLPGNVAQRDVPRWFASARVFLFPTAWDPWGVVANEACLAGLPTIVSPYAGAADELICDGANGYVRALELPLWVEAAVKLLSDHSIYSQLSDRARELVIPYSFERAAIGIADAVKLAAA